MKLNTLFSIVFVCSFAAAAQGRSAILLSETWTGQQLYENSFSADPRVTFPTRTPDLVSGTSLFFGTGSVRMEKLLVLDLFPENSLDPSEPVVVHIHANITRQIAIAAWTWDHDPGFAVGDGAKIVGFLAADDAGYGMPPGEGYGVVYNDLGTVGQMTHGHSMFIDAGYPAIGETLDVETNFTLFGDSTEIYGAFGTKSGTHTFPTALSLENPLSFIFMAHDRHEQYQLNWLTIEVQGTESAVIPEPSSLVLFAGLSLIGLAMARRWKRR